MTQLPTPRPLDINALVCELAEQYDRAHPVHRGAGDCLRSFVAVRLALRRVYLDELGQHRFELVVRETVQKRIAGSLATGRRQLTRPDRPQLCLS